MQFNCIIKSCHFRSPVNAGEVACRDTGICRGLVTKSGVEKGYSKMANDHKETSSEFVPPFLPKAPSMQQLQQENVSSPILQDERINESGNRMKESTNQLITHQSSSINICSLEQRLRKTIPGLTTSLPFRSSSVMMIAPKAQRFGAN